MHSRTRAFSLAVLAAAAAACSPDAERSTTLDQASRPASATVATFEGSFDPATGALTIRTTPSPSLASVMAYTPWVDGVPGAGPKDTFELRNGTVTGSALACSGSASWEGDVILTSFFDTQAFSDVAIELTSLVPAGNEACNSAAPYDGMSAAYGLWDYGTIGINGSATRTWRFANPDSETFTFRGRIMATVSAIPAPANGAGSFEWAPYMFADPPHSFQQEGTTLSHVFWNGSAFVDLVGPLDFAPVGAVATNNPVGVTFPVQQWAGPFASGANRYQATDALGLDGDFTACVKFRPGADPAVGDRKVLLAKGSPVNGGGDGWALSQQHGAAQQYGMWYSTPTPSGSYDTFLSPGTDHPEHSSFDYICGGRDGSNVRVVSHGRDVRFPLSVTGSFPTPDTLPLVIGAQADGGWPSADGGVYEVIFDSRPATPAVMVDIVSRAEGRRLYNGASYTGNNTDALPVVGADGAIYHFPFGATAPVSADGSGLLDAGTLLYFGGTTAFFGGTLAGSPSNYCVGAEVVSAGWASATGCVLGDVDGYLKIFFLGDGVAATAGNGQWRALGGDKSVWSANSRHKLMVCSPGATANTADLYVDGSLVGSSLPGSPQFDLTAGQLEVGTCGFGGGDLTGARIGRVFACPTSDHAQCN
jgi:hypothetical protein